MIQANISIGENNTECLESPALVISARKVTTEGSCEIVVGYPGLPNAVKKLKTGDAILFESPKDGLIEVRLINPRYDRGVSLLVTQVSPRLGLMGGFSDYEETNTPFTSDEKTKIENSIKHVKEELKEYNDFSTEQLDLIYRKLHDIQDASERLGRKDWINYVAGTLTTLCVSAAFAPETAKTIFKVFSSAFRWLFDNALILLQ